MEKKIGLMYLDTTYCAKGFEFPPQKECCEYVADVISTEIRNDTKNKTLFFIGTYTLGKEKILIEVAKKTGKKVIVDETRLDVIRNCGLDIDVDELFTCDEKESCIKAITLYRFNYVNLRGKLAGTGFSRAVAFCPRGFSRNFGSTNYGSVTMHSVPYSEHSSLAELRDCVEFFGPTEIIPTVNNDGGKSKVAKMVSLLK